MPALIAVYLEEKIMKLFSGSPFPFVSPKVDMKVKWEKTGRRKMEGWTRKVFRIVGCQQEKRLRKKNLKIRKDMRRIEKDLR